MPNATALVAELAPARRRAALIIVMFMGAFVGSAAPSFVIAHVSPAQSIVMLFVLGGAAPIIIAVGATLFLPESALGHISVVGELHLFLGDDVLPVKLVAADARAPRNSVWGCNTNCSALSIGRRGRGTFN